MEEYNLTTNKKKKWLLPVIIAAILIIAAIIIAIIYNLPANRRNRQLALAEKYMSELNYEAAVLAYRAAIEIDPMCEDAYIKLFDLYIATEAYDEAVNVLNSATLYLNPDILSSKYNELTLLKANGNSDTEDKDTNDIKQNQTINKDDVQNSALTLVKKVFSYNGADELTSWNEYVYDINDNLIIDTLYDNENNIVHQYNYDSLGNITADSIGRPWEERVYDENGRIAQFLIHKTGIDATLQYRKEYSYDEYDNVVSITAYNPDNTIRDYNEYVYDGNHNLFQYVEYYSNGIVRAYHNYDDSGNEISSTYYNQDGTISGINYIFEYNNNQLIKKNGYYADGSIYDWTDYTYDSKGNLLSNITYNSDNSIASYYRYEYDSNGNCIIEEHYTNYNQEYDDYYIRKNSYDEKDNMLKSESFDREGNILSKTEYNYEYK